VTATIDLAGRLLDIKRIYHEPGIERFDRARQVLDRFPDAQLIEVPSHQAIPGLYGNEGNAQDWVRTKREVLVLGEKKSLSARRNERSSDWIAPSTANGCAMACSYCYVPRRKGYANPITVFANIDKVVGYLERHAARQGVKPEPNQCDPVNWIYDIGENSDCSVDALVSDNVADLVDLFARLPNAKASFATKLVNRDLHEDWLADWAELLEQVADGANERTKAQLAAEVIFLTHNEGLHEVNLGWHPKGEELLWRPDLQQLNRSQSGQWNVRYKSPWKGRWVQQLTDLVADKLPTCRIRYAF
jgi:spore photoproduct lyase